MGCGHSKESDNAARPVNLQPLPTHASSTSPSATAVAKPSYSSGGQPGPSRQNHAPESNSKVLASRTRRDFLATLHKGLHDRSYVVIGGSALAEHGNLRETTDVDVLIGGGYSKRSIEDLLSTRCSGRFVRLGQGKMGFVASDGQCYPLDLSTDTDVDLPFDDREDTTMKGGARVATLSFLLNSKARAWQTRVPFEHSYEQKRGNDAADIFFCLDMLRGTRNADGGVQLNWVYTRNFWLPFRTAYPESERLFRDAGLWTDETDFPSGSSGGGRSSRSNSSSMVSFGSQQH